MATREPRFTDLDRAELLALALYRSGLCPHCGQPVRVCTSHEETGPAFAVSYTACRATIARLEALRGLTDGGETKLPNLPAYLWSTTRKG